MYTKTSEKFDEYIQKFRRLNVQKSRLLNFEDYILPAIEFQDFDQKRKLICNYVQNHFKTYYLLFLTDFPLKKLLLYFSLAKQYFKSMASMLNVDISY